MAPLKKQPKFWQKKTLLSFLLWPVSRLYAFIVRRVIARQRPKNLPILSICIGNSVVGGAGKTPVTLAIAAQFCKKGKRVQIILKGYGGKTVSPTRVDISAHSVADVGDEAIMVARKGFEVWVGASRFDVAQAAIHAGGDVLLFDDGFQDLTINFTERLLLVGESIGNGFVLPAGPLREDIWDAVARATGLICMGSVPAYLSSQSLPTYLAQREVILPTEFDPSLPAIAFCGIGNPAQFERLLQQKGIKLVDFYAFPDHHPYTEEQINALLDAAKSVNAQVLTTEKDFVKVPLKFVSQIHVVRLHIKLDPEKWIDDLIG